MNYADYQLVKKVYFHIQNKYREPEDFEGSVYALEADGFLQVKNGYIITWEIYFCEIITQNDYIDFEKDIVKLIPLFASLKKAEELFFLSLLFFENNSYENVIDCYRFIIDIVEKIDHNNKCLGTIYYNWGTALKKLGEFNRDSAKLTEACEKFKLTTEQKGFKIDVFNNWANALIKLGELEMNVHICLNRVKSLSMLFV